MNLNRGRNIYLNAMEPDVTASSSSSNMIQVRRRHYTHTDDKNRRNRQHMSLQAHLLTSIRGLVGRARSESMSNESKKAGWPINKALKRVQVESCTLDSVYDLREEDEPADLYDDSLAFRRPRSYSTEFLILRKTSRPLSVDVLGLVDNSDPYKQYMQVVDCYELAPHTGSVILVDGSLSPQKAFKVLTEWKVGAAVVWSSIEHRVASILTLTDFLIFLLSGISSSSTTVIDTTSSNRLVWLNASCKLLEACNEFFVNRVHRILILDHSGDILYLLTAKRILQAVHKQHRSLHFASWLNWKIRKANIGTWKNLQTVNSDDTLDIVAQKMLDFRISSVPIVNNCKRPIDSICKFDIANALSDVQDFQKSFRTLKASEAVACRCPSEFLDEKSTVGHVLDFALNRRDCRCVFITDASKQRLLGAVSLSDFITHILNDNIESEGNNDDIVDTSDL